MLCKIDLGCVLEERLLWSLVGTWLANESHPEAFLHRPLQKSICVYLICDCFFALVQLLFVPPDPRFLHSHSLSSFCTAIFKHFF